MRIGILGAGNVGGTLGGVWAGKGHEIGFEPVDVGPLKFAHQLEALAQLWGQLAYGQKLGRSIAFRLLQR